MTPPRTIVQAADLVGRERYTELALFGALGARLLRATEPAVMVLLSGAALGHAWRAQVLEELLPVSLGLPGVEEATRSAGAELDRAVARLGDEADDFGLAAALANVVYPAMLDAYRAHLVSCSEISEPPAMRALRRVIADLEVQSDELYSLVGADEGVPRGSAGEVAGLLDRLGGPFGRIE